VSPVKYELGFYIPEDDILHSHRREDLRICTLPQMLTAMVDIRKNMQPAREKPELHTQFQ
jgi:hypothetical protein